MKTLYEGENFQLYHVIRPGMDPNELNPPKSAKPVKLPATPAKPAPAEVAAVPGAVVPPAAVIPAAAIPAVAAKP